jgi:hypothetical protein
LLQFVLSGLGEVKQFHKAYVGSSFAKLMM